MHNQNILKPNQASDSTLSIAIKAVWMMTVLTLLLGVAYPLVMTGLAQAIFPNQANGSLVQDNGITVGSQLIGQDFSSTPYFQSRPSMTTETPYNAQGSSGSNLGTTNPKQQFAIEQRSNTWHAKTGSTEKVPVDLLTASGSGLDPHITAQAAYYQMPKVAERTGLSINILKRLIEANTERAIFGHHAYVNVLALNLSVKTALQKQK